MIRTPLSTVIGGAFWTPSATILGGTSKKTFDQIIKSLFANNEQGFVYDPNDLTTMFQDSAGTIPVTGAGQPVGLILDKSKGLVLGSERLTNGDFESGLPAFKDDGATAISTLGLNTNNPISGTKDGLLTISQVGAGRPSLVFTTPAKSLGGLYELSFDYKVISGNIILTNIYNGSGTNILNKALTGAGRATLRYISRGVDTIDALYFGDSVGAIQIDNVSVRQVLGNHAYQTTSASRPILRQNATTGAYYLEFDGGDDFLVTNSINFTATDKISLFAGVRKLSDAGRAIMLELGTNGVNTFLMQAPSVANNKNIAFTSGGIFLKSDTVVAASPISIVLTAKADIQNDYVTLIANGGINTPVISDQGVGNYQNAPIYIGRRAGTSLPFNGHIYGLIGIGRLTTNAETATIEKELAKRTGVTLSV